MSLLSSCFGKSCIEEEKDDFEEYLKNNPEIAERLAAKKVRNNEEAKKIAKSFIKEADEERKKKKTMRNWRQG